MYIFQLGQRISGKLRECGNTLKQLRHLIEQNVVTESETTNYTSCYESEALHFSPVHGTDVRKLRQTMQHNVKLTLSAQ